MRFTVGPKMIEYGRRVRRIDGFRDYELLRVKRFVRVWGGLR